MYAFQSLLVTHEVLSSSDIEQQKNKRNMKIRRLQYSKHQWQVDLKQGTPFIM